MEQRILDKKISGGLKNCPIHRFGAFYDSIGSNWYKCQKCGGHQMVPPKIGRSKKVRIKKSLTGRTVYEFKNYIATII